MKRSTTSEHDSSLCQLFSCMHTEHPRTGLQSLESSRRRPHAVWVKETYSTWPGRRTVATPRLAVRRFSAGIWLYDARTGEEMSLITGHSFRVNAVAFSPDGLTLASGSRDDTVRLWDAETGTGKKHPHGTYLRRRGGGILAGRGDAGKRQSRRYGARCGTCRHRAGEKHSLLNEKYQGNC